MSRKTPLPRLPSVIGGRLDAKWAEDLIRTLEQTFAILQNPGEGRNTTAVYTALPSTDRNLEPGSLFQINGVIRITALNLAYPEGLYATGQVGTVTVNTT